MIKLALSCLEIEQICVFVHLNFFPQSDNKLAKLTCILSPVTIPTMNNWYFSAFGQNYLILPAQGHPHSFWRTLLSLWRNEVTVLSCAFMINHSHLSSILPFQCFLPFQIPFEQEIRSASDDGSPIVTSSAPQPAAAKAYTDMALKVTCSFEALAKEHLLGPEIMM